ncbi:CAP domain-containing protein [Microvirga arabica]|uniref:CAP domain-containing protein n=1 Tax=Microvirga arabica TaxID=1128671 RepID=UPI00193A3B0C|nr:CAP domain-containing protein [Microvirga arabica]MBM1170061.1 CAP domain-containing protein [Microvirga arabica]
MRRLRCLASALTIVASLVGWSAPMTAAETGNLDQLRQKALELVNRERQELGLEPLSLGPALNEAAQSHAQDMLQRNYYAHTSPQGNTVADRYSKAGGSRWHVIAENIARCQGCPSPPTEESVAKLHRGWMNSPPHRENILRRGLDRFGFGIIAAPNQALYAVQTFAGAGTPREVQPGGASIVTGADDQTALALQQINRERSDNGRRPLEADPTLARAASKLAPQADQDMSNFDLQGRLSAVLAADAPRNWQSLAAILGRCGGCGTEPTEGDIRHFVGQWLEDPGYRSRLLSRDFTHFGLALETNGDGLKTASAVLGQRR